MTFDQVKVALSKNIDDMFHRYGRLYVVDVDKDVLWNLYLESFPSGTNEMYKARREHDCQHCKQFIRQFGNVVAIREDSTVRSIWDFEIDDDTYKVVFSALKNFILSNSVTNIFSTTLPMIGVDFNMAQDKKNGTVIKWQHFFTKIPKTHQNKTQDSDESIMATKRDMKNVLKRSIETISDDALDTVIELINQNSIYKGVEWLTSLQKLVSVKKEFNSLPKNRRDNFCWITSEKNGPVLSKIRNHSIGVLLVDISEGNVSLDDAVRKYEAIVAPTNYKRPKAIFTQKMLEDAKDEVERLGLTASLRRRFATIDDITVNNVLFADRDSTKRMKNEDIFDELSEDIKINPKSFDRATEIQIDKFISDVLPTATKVELLLENRHRSNIVSLIAPVHPDSKPMFKWGNNFSWAYVGNITDSMKERVKEAGGSVTGALRFSIQWNENKDNENDYDAHCKEPNGSEIYFGRKISTYTKGSLDVDIIRPNQKIAVENITYPSTNNMIEGTYEFYVDVYSNRGGKNGFRAQIEFNGVIHDFNINNPSGSPIPVAKVRYTKANGFELWDSDKSGTATSLDIAGLKTNTLQPVSLFLLSPNFWDDKKIGNKHYMFILKGCVNDECPNGFFNEFLLPELEEHKRVFAALGSKMMVEPSTNQLSGLGFSVTKKDSIMVKVHGHTVRLMKVII